MAEEALPQVHAQPSGIGGWLVLPALGTLVTPFLLAKTAYDNVEALLTFQVSATLKAFIMIETLGNLAFSLAWFYRYFCFGSIGHCIRGSETASLTTGWWW